MKKSLFILLLTVISQAISAQGTDIGANIGFTAYTRQRTSPGIYASLRAVKNYPSGLVSFAGDLHTMNNRSYFGPLSGRIIGINAAFAARIPIDKSYMYLGPLAGVALMSYELRNGARSSGTASFTFGGQAGFVVYMSKNIGLNLEVSPRWLSSRGNYFASMPEMYLPVSAGLRFRLP